MKPIIQLILGLVVIGLSHSAASIDKTSRQAFDQLLNEAGLRLDERQNYSDIPIQANPVLPYEHAMLHASGALELRFIVRPLNRITIEYNDPHNASPEPNHLFPLLFESITNRLSAGSDTPSSAFSESEARTSFNASWAAASVFDVRPEFADDYRNGLLIGMHRNDMADAYTVFLYNDHELAKPLINEVISIMSFTPESN
ncbi:MAG: hypothetical protein [Olavius algarvensis Gamma 3 endosymbiont]|nr:MAG: hypothetical protein [Olavius algarvensis Gamma 3 endosymbiont]